MGRNNNTFSQPTSRIQTHRREGVTTDAPEKVHKVPRGATVKIYPTTPGLATVYSTNTPSLVSNLDDTNIKIESSTNASWDEWGAGQVSEKTIQQTNVPIEVVALVVTSGVWVIEVTAQ